MIEVIVSQCPTPPPPFVSRFPVILGWFDNPRLMASQPQLTKYAVRVNRPSHLPGPLQPAFGHAQSGLCVTLNTREWDPRAAQDRKSVV